MRDYLRFDRRFEINIFESDPNPPYVGKPRLGIVSPRQPLEMLDFDGNGSRDLAVFKTRPTDSLANTAQWVIRHAPSFGTEHVRRFGRLDDVPVPGFYDADSATDQAVYRPGEVGSGAETDASNWYWCPSNCPAMPPGCPPTPPNCELGGWASDTFGVREDLPLPNLKFGTGRYLAVYRPSNGTFYWRAIGGGTMYTAAVAPSGAGQRSMPLPGLYDSDDLVDLATYDPITGRFDLALSTEGWSVATKRVRVFPSKYQMSFAAGTIDAQARAGGIPVRGVRRALSGGQIRTVFALYDPEVGRGDIAWDVLTATSSPWTATTASFGSLGNAAFGGINANPAPYDYLLGVTWGNPATLTLGVPDAFGVLSSTPASNNLNIRNDFFGGLVADLSGDGVPDLLLHDGEAGSISIIPSPFFSSSVGVPMGGPYAQLL